MRSPLHDRPRSTLLPWESVCALLLLAACAHTPYRTASLDYRRGNEARDCADDAELRGLVRRSLGYDPFRERASWKIVARIEEADGQRVGRVGIVDARGNPLGTREITASERSCRALVEALALAISVAIDPAAGTGAPKAKAPTPARFQVGVGGGFELGGSPGLTGGLTVAAAVRWSRVSLELSAVVSAPRHEDLAGGGRLGVFAAGATTAGCGHYAFAFACALVAVRAVHGWTTDLTESGSSTLPYFGPGLRLGAHLGHWGRLSARIQADLIVALAGVRFTDERETADFWRSPALSGGLHLMLMIDAFRRR